MGRRGPLQWPHAGTAREDEPHGVGPGRRLRRGVKAARSALELGVKTIVDPTAMFLGRDVSFMRRVAEETGLQVIPCTGIYTYDYLPTFLISRTLSRSPTSTSHDIEVGIQDTEIKAAFIKCAADEPGVNENIEKLHRAAAQCERPRPARRSWPTRGPPATPLRARSRSSSRRASTRPRSRSPTRGDTDDLDQIERILDTGVWIGLDRYGLEMYLPYDRRQATTLALLERGYADRDLPLRRLLRDDRLVPGRADRAADRRRAWPTTGTSGSSPRG